MPFEIMDQRGGSAPTHFLDEISFPAEKQIGFSKSNFMSDKKVGSDGTVPMSGNKFVASSPLENFSPVGIPSIDWLVLRQLTLARDEMKSLGIGGEGGASNFSEASWNPLNHHPNSWSNLSVQPVNNCLSGNRGGINGIQSESSLFSSSLSDIFNRNLKLSGNDILRRQPFNTVAYSHHWQEEPFESLKEIEAQTIGNLLPDEDDLFSGVIHDLGHNFQLNTGDGLEEFDLFSSSGGMELEGDDRFYPAPRNSDIIGGASDQGGSAGLVVGEHPYGEHPSRTLFVRNINSNIEDSELKAVFEQFGDIRTIYTACKHRGFVMISYYDIRAACNAMKALQNKPLRRRKLDIHYSIPKDNPSEKDNNQGTLVVFNLDSSVSIEELRQIFAVYGEIREIRETPHKRNHKFIEFYDIRAAEAALRALNRSDIAGKQIKLEASRPGGARRFTLQLEQEQDEPNLCRGSFDDLSSRQMVSSGIITSTCMDNGSVLFLHSAIRSPAIAFTESHLSSSVPNCLPSPARVGSVGKQSGIHEPNLSLDEMKFGKRQPSFHPHSFPEYHDSLANGLPNDSPSMVADIASNDGTKIKDGLDGRHIRGVSSNEHLMEPTGGVFGSPRNGSYSLHGNPYGWNNSNSRKQHPSCPMVGPNSLSFLNGLHANRVPHMPGFPRVHPFMLNATSPAHPHIGSAPVVNPSLWDRQHAHAEPPETSNFHLGSLGSGGFLGHSPSHHMDIASQNIFSHVGGNCIDMSKNVGMRSPQQMCHLFPGRNPGISMLSSFDSSNERMRNLSYRRNESNPNHSDKKQYELDVDLILRGEDSRTTLMIKNIPNKYTSKMLLSAIDEHCRGTYDFIYLPIDFKNKCNVGYAFINMIDPRQIIPFHQAFNGKKWEKFNSEKVAALAYARIQGKAALIAHFQNSSLMNEDKRCRPILFHTDGPNAGDPEPFPMGTNIRSRLGKPRTNGNENESFPSVSATGEESPKRSDSSGSLKDAD